MSDSRTSWNKDSNTSILLIGNIEPFVHSIFSSLIGKLIEAQFLPACKFMRKDVNKFIN